MTGTTSDRRGFLRTLVADRLGTETRAFGDALHPLRIRLDVATATADLDRVLDGAAVSAS